VEQRNRVYAWEFPVRLTHWFNVLSLITFAVSGLYIGNPYAHAHESHQWIMGWMRTLHFIAGYVFLMSFIIRIYWFFMGNRYASWRMLFPFTSQQRSNLANAISFYTFISKKPPYAVGHTALAGLVYLVVFVLFAFQIVSGFAMYSLSSQSVIATVVGGWFLSVMELQTIRLFHHITMYLIFAFVLVHVYIAWWMDTVERNGVMGSIFGGYKFVTGKERE
jgi:Ni/Fe-hydrogenase 1 B-type cytochrome subunit